MKSHWYGLMIGGLKWFVPVLMTIGFTGDSFAQKSASEAPSMIPQKLNFLYFTSPRHTSEEIWDQYNGESFASHPERGQIPFNGPDTPCVEILEKRKVNERYFINPERPSEFFLQKSLGDLHYQDQGQWLTIDHHLRKKGPGHYEASQQPEPVGFDIQEKASYIRTLDGEVKFNQWVLLGLEEGTEHPLASADWSHYTAGDDGLFIRDIFPGIDAEMQVIRGAIKTNFIVREWHFGSVSELIFRDQFDLAGEGEFLSFAAPGTSQTGTDRVILRSGGVDIVEMSEAIAYAKGEEKESFTALPYALDGNTSGVRVSAEWLKGYLVHTAVVIDPLVISSNTLAQAAITGSMYNASCNFDQSCDYSLVVNTPTGADLTDLQWTFNYQALGQCFLEDGAVRFTLGNCTSPGQTGYYWFCNQVGTGTCTGSNISVFDDLSACLTAASCSQQPLTFGMKFYRGCWGSPGCNNTCIGAATPWTITIRGYTVEFVFPSPNAFSISPSTVCAGQDVTVTSNGAQYGIPPYTYSWSLSPGGTPVIATGSPATINLPNAGNATIFCFLRDVCGQPVSAYKPIVVTSPPAPPAVVSPVNYCLNAPAQPLTANGTNLKWYATPTGGSPINAPVPSTLSPGTVTYYVSQTVGSCESARVPVDVIVHPPPAVSGQPVITPSSCNGSDGSITGLIAAGNGPFISIWSNTVPVVVSTSATSTSLTNQPAGDYMLLITDGLGCPGIAGPYTIPNYSPPPPPAVTSPVSYCPGASASPLNAQGSNLLWYNTSSGGSGSVVAITPSTQQIGSAVYYVSQTVNGCESARAAITVDVVNLPSPPAVVSPVQFCTGEIAAPLTANGSGLLWYTSSAGGNGDPVAPLPSTTSVGSQSFYVTQTIGCESSRTELIVQVFALPVILGQPEVTPSSCDVNDGAISGLNASGQMPLNYEWFDEVPTLVFSSNSSAGLINQAPGNYNLLVTDGNGCSASYGPVVITQAAPPLPPQVFSPQQYCLNEIPAPLNASGNNLLWYATQAGGVGTIIPPTPSTTIEGINTFYVSQTVQGCESSRAAIEVIVNPPPPAPAVETPIEYCQGESAFPLTASGNNNLWYVSPQSGTGSSLPPLPDTSTPGIQSYFVSQLQGTCESARAQIEIITHSLPTVNLSADSISGCAPLCANFTDTGTSSPAGIMEWIWSSDGTMFSSAQSPAFCFSSPGSYDITLQVLDGNGCMASETAADLIDVESDPQVFIYVDKTEITPADPHIQFTAESVLGTTFYWVFAEGDTVQGPQVSRAFFEGGFHCVKVIAESPAGCLGENSRCIQVVPEFRVYIPNSFTPDMDGLNDAWRPHCLGITGYHLVIYNRWGQRVFETKDPERYWMGQVDSGGHYVQSDIYHYKLEVRDFGGKPHEYNGLVIPLR